MLDPKELIGEKMQYIGRVCNVCWFGFGDLREKHDQMLYALLLVRQF